MSTVFSHTRAEPAQAIPAVPVPLDDPSTVGRRYPGDVGRLAALFRAHLHRCVVYIDFNMVRAGVVKHPAEWPHSGYLAIQQPPKRYRVVDLLALSKLCGFDDIREFQKARREWVEAGLCGDMARRDDRWSESIAVGSEGFVNQVKIELGFKAQHREVLVADGLYTLQEPVPLYGDHFDRENKALRPNNTVPWANKP